MLAGILISGSTLIMKIIIPVAGIGSKLRPHTHTQPKALVPVAGKPILAHIVDHLVEAGCDDFIFIIGYLGDKIESFISEKYPKIKRSFVVQEPREGTDMPFGWPNHSCLPTNPYLLFWVTPLLILM